MTQANKSLQRTRPTSAKFVQLALLHSARKPGAAVLGRAAELKRSAFVLFRMAEVQLPCFFTDTYRTTCSWWILMGLQISHGCWQGSYSAFHEWRQALARTIAIDLTQMEGFAPYHGTAWSALPADPLHLLLRHADDQGEITAADCRLLVQRLKDIYRHLPVEPERGTASVRAKTKNFIHGLRRAVRANEPIVFG